MSVSCVKIVDSELLKKVALYCAKEFVLVNVDPITRNQFPFPADYKFAPCFLPQKYAKFADRIENYKVRPDDMWIVTFPKAGTTWIVNIVWQLKNKLDFSADYRNASYMFLEGNTLDDECDDNKDNEVYISFMKAVDRRLDDMEKESSPRIIKSHLPAHLLPKSIWTVQPKIIYMYRNAKDSAISMYHMFRNGTFLNYQGSLEDFFDLFLDDHVIHAPFHPHVNGFRKLKYLNHILLLSYDEMIVDPFSGVKKISEFLGYSYTDEQLKQLMQHVSFEKMQKSNQSPENEYNFFRKGKSGGYRDEMSPEYIRKFDEWENQNKH